MTNNKKRKICIFSESWESGGIESFLNNILHHMELKNLEIDIVTAELRKSVFTQGLRDLGINFIELSGSLRHIHKNHRLFMNLIQNRQYDVLHLNAYQGMTLYYAELARRAGVQVRIAHSHNTTLRKSILRPIKQLLHRIYRQRYTSSATHLWACSKNAAAFLFSSQELKNSGYQFIPNGIDVERFRFQPEVRERVRHEMGLDDKFVVGNVGRLCYQKNQSFLLDVLKELLRIRPDSILLLVGEGEDRDSLKIKAEKLGIEKQVIFLGTCDHIERLLWAMDVFAFPSRFEGLGIAVVEAQAVGLPVVCSENVPEEAQIMDDLCGIPLSMDKWVEEIIFISGHTNSADAWMQVRISGFNIKDVSTEVENLYEGIPITCCEHLM